MAEENSSLAARSARAAKRSPSLWRLLLHSKIENDTEGFIRDLLQEEAGKQLLQQLLHAAADSGSLDLLHAGEGSLEAGLRHLPALQLLLLQQQQQQRGRAAAGSSSSSTAPPLLLLPAPKAPFRGQMFLCAHRQEDSKDAEFVIKFENLFPLLGSQFFPPRPHAAPKSCHAERYKSH
ncbi:hypothetical protein, conserved [Eimeria tenella]|uniref:Uncharacterized protein n=1 Tax=Eimeria tenella TaxID=5802 RepID=U6KUA5_EIMTE|nr:hypothetical protein, conserved [Eimeria tenella]CDJ39090.1 hypothetical protein, conserved [Eimeria tenella]|eukprot:XP_013229845.1 hypothetical protein, conserved [Eimeria tenella]